MFLPRLFLIAAIAAPLHAATPEIDVETLRSVTKTLSDDSFEGRAPATPAEEKTIAYIAGRFADAGLQPGNEGSWYQDVPLVEISSSPTALTVSGGREPLSFAYKTDMVVSTYRVAPEAAVRNSDIVFVGYGINAPERGWNDYAGIDVKGKTVVILVNDPDWQAETLDGPFGGKAMTYYGRWTYKYEEAARQGAAAALIVHDTAPASYGWNVVRSSWTGPQLGMDEPGNHLDQSQAIGWLSNDAAQRLFAAAGQDFTALTAAAKQPGFKAIPFNGLKASLSMTNAIRRQASKNVIGILPGRTRPDEYVLYTAHWDHLGRCEAVDGDDICNGAIDNATGIAALVALAQAHRKAGAPERSIVFLAVTAEESGLLGSQYYAANPVFPLARTAGGVNMDALNVHGATRDIIVVGGGKSELETILADAVKAEGRVIMPEAMPQAGFFYRSDHFSLARQGVPMIYFDSGMDMIDGGVAKGRALAEDYIKLSYHAPGDEYDPAWSFEGTVADLKLYYRVGRTLADSDRWPNWYPDAEFRAARDASLKAR